VLSEVPNTSFLGQLYTQKEKFGRHKKWHGVIKTNVKKTGGDRPSVPCLRIVQ